MTAPSTTVFEVKISNKLSIEPVFVKLQAEVQYATHLTSSSKNWDAQKSYHETADSNGMEERKYDQNAQSSARFSDNKSHIKSSDTSHQSSASTKASSTNVGVKGKYGIASVNINVNRNKSSSSSSSSSSHETRDNLQHNINSQQQSEMNINSSLQKRNNAESNILSNEYDKRNEFSSSTTRKNTIIEPGFVRIAPFQSISIPVIIAYESQVVYITIYIENKEGEKLFISNGLQINRQHIDIIRNIENGYIEIHPTTKVNDNNNKLKQFRVFLLKWGFPDYLCDAMQNAGWYDMKMWDKLSDNHLIDMGFKSGHIILLREKYKKYLRKKHKIKSDIDCSHLLREWNLPNYLYENMINNGWDDVGLWIDIEIKDLIDMGFKKGHIRKFEKYVNKNNDHLKQLEKLRNDLKLNKICIDIETDDDDDDNYNDENKFDLKIPETPKFKINSKKILCHSFEIELETIQKNERYVVEIAENNARWEGVGDLKKIKTRRIDGLKENTNYSVRIFAQNQHLKKSKYSHILHIKTLNTPKCHDIKWNDFKFLSIKLEKNSIQQTEERDDIKVAMQIAMIMDNKNNEEHDEKIQFKDIGFIKKNEINYKCNIQQIMNTIYKHMDEKISIRFKITQNNYSEFTKTHSFLIRKCFVEHENNRIKLQHHSNKYHFCNDDKYHPKHILIANDKEYYVSERANTFKENENDWMIFKIQQNQLYFPTKFILKNPGDGQSVKTMKILIGDGISKWYDFKVNNESVINCAMTAEYQSFDIDGIDYKQIQKHSLKYIKLEFIQNHGQSDGYPLFSVKEFRLHGIEINNV